MNIDLKFRYYKYFGQYSYYLKHY